MRIIVPIGWPEVKQIWSEHLWPDRKDINRMSSMSDAHNLDKNIFKAKYNTSESNYQPYFFGCRIDNILVGVNSGHQTSDTHFRSRGLFVLPNYRRLNIGTELLLATIKKAQQQKCKIIWTMPRKTALATYENVGFIKKSDWFKTETVLDRRIKLLEANCYAERKLDE